MLGRAVVGMAEIIVDPESILGRAQRRIMVIRPIIGQATWTAIGYDNSRNMTAAEIRTAI
jgi:hypothetical protein